MFDITDKKVVITGGANGIGFEMVQAFLNAGAEVLVIDISPRLPMIHQALTGDLSKLKILKGNLLDFESIPDLFERAIEELDGSIDVLINNAGIIERGNAFDLSSESWQRMLDLNVTTVFELSRLAAHEMKKKGQGKIINLGSILSVLGGFNAVAYATTKGAILQLTKSLSNEWAAEGIQVNALAPGYMLTAMNEGLMNDPVRKSQVEARIPVKRWGTAKDVAGVALFLASPASDYVTGTVIPVDGGVLGR